MAKTRTQQDGGTVSVEAEAEEAGGFPEHGDEYQDGETPASQEPGQQQQQQQQPGDDNHEEPKRDPVYEQMSARLEQQEREIKRLQSMIPPSQPKQEEEPKKEEEPDWDDLIFRDPKEAMRRHGELVAKRVTNELRQEYQRDQGTQRFWDQFCDKHPDLKDDRDLVEVTLNGKLNQLANVPVSEAIDQLADLTRDRIQRYSGQQKKEKGKKVRVEGGQPPKQQQTPPEEPEITSLSDLVKARKAKKATAA